MTLEELYKHGTAMLEKAGVDNPSVDAFYLLEYAAGLNRTKYLMFREQQVTQLNIRQYEDLIEQRCTRIPYQYITGRADFAGLVFEVDPSVLIPRLDTEVLFEQALRSLGHHAYVLDLCTGSGALGISLKRYRPDIHMVLSDLSEEALKTAGRNIENNHLEIAKQTHAAASPEDLVCGYDLGLGIRVIRSDLFNDMSAQDEHAEGYTGCFDVIVSNPPYVTEEEYENLMPEVKNHEPKLALTAGADGLDAYRRIAADAPQFLKDGGTMLLEIGCSQADSVSTLLKENGWNKIRVIQDLAGLDRVIICKKGAENV